jgi:hypothetical protein
VIGSRIDVEWDRFDYVFGLLMDEGLVADEHFMAAGGATLIVTPDGWDLLSAEAQNEVARFMRPSSEVEVRAPADEAGDNGVSDTTSGERATGDVAEAVPAGRGDSGAASPARGARSRARRPGKETTKGAH